MSASQVKPYRVRFTDGTVVDGFTKAAAARRHAKADGRSAVVETFERGHWLPIGRQPSTAVDERAHYRCQEVIPMLLRYHFSNALLRIMERTGHAPDVALDHVTPNALVADAWGLRTLRSPWLANPWRARALELLGGGLRIRYRRSSAFGYQPRLPGWAGREATRMIVRQLAASIRPLVNPWLTRAAELLAE